MKYSLKTTAFIAIILGTVATGIGPILAKFNQLDAIAITFYRLLFALPIIYLFVSKNTAAQKNDEKPNVRTYFLMLLAGVVFAIDTAIFYQSLHYTKIANSILIVNLAPVLVILFSWIFLGLKPNRQFFSGVVFALLGMVALTYDNFDFTMQSIYGEVLAFMAAIFYAMYILLISHVRQHISTRTVMLWTTLGGALFAGIYAFFYADVLFINTWQNVALSFSNGAIAHVLGHTLIIYAMHHLSATVASLGLMFQPVVTMMLGWWLFSEILTIKQLIGATMIMSGIVMAKIFER